MGNYTYKCVPVPSMVEIGKNKSLEAIKKYEDKINKMALEGWELVLIDSLIIPIVYLNALKVLLNIYNG